MFGSVFVAKRGSLDGEKVVVKKSLSKDDYEQRLFMKEATIPRVSSLDDFLLLIESRGVIQQFPFHYRIAEDSARGLAYLSVLLKRYPPSLPLPHSTF